MDGVAEVYEDGGYTGGNLNRPSLSRLLSAVEQGLVDVIVIYKLDRLTRSLSDFIRLIDLLDQYEVTFVSVTQAFDTQDSMGRLVLNILLTFAQFEREMLADRIRDKAHALRRAGRWIGGAAPFGYDLVDHRLVLNREEAAVVRLVHARYLELRSSNQVVCEMRAAGMLSKAWINRRGVQCGGNAITQSVIYGMLGNPLYLGEFHVDGEVIKALHQPIVDRGVWQEVRDLKESRRLKKPPDRPQEHLLLGFTFDDLGRKMVVAAGVRKGSAYRYYTSTPNHRLSRSGTKALRAGATDLEELVRAAVATFLRDRPQVSQAVHALGHRDEDTDRLIDRGGQAARWIETFDRRRLRRAWEALIERIELSRERVLIILRCEQVRAFVAWPGNGLFKMRPNADGRHHHVFVLEAEAFAVRTERQFRLPIDVGRAAGAPKRGLVDLMTFARQVQGIVYGERRSVEEVARRFSRRPTFVSRALRLNYLAPDIIAAIVDGRQPRDLTRRKLLNASIPMDWAQQRALLGFPSQHDPKPRDEHY
jgi:site-specific DNA recombinase